MPRLNLFSLTKPRQLAAIHAGADACAAAAAFGIQGLVGIFGRDGQGAAAIGDSAAAGILGHVLLDAGRGRRLP